MKKVSLLLIIFGLIAVAYANSLFHQFVYDDAFVVVDNPFVKSWDNIPKVFSRDYITSLADLQQKSVDWAHAGSGEASFRPLVTLSYFLDYALWKLHPFGFHLTNILIHAGNGMVLFFLILLLTSNTTAAFWGTLFFVLHPINSEVVNVISFREDSFVTLFWMLAFYFYVRLGQEVRERSSFIGLSIVFYVLALMSKEMAFVFPLFLFSYHWISQSSLRAAIGNFLKRDWIYWLILFIFLYVYYFVIGKNQAMIDPISKDIFIHVGAIINVFFQYLAWFIVPVSIYPTVPEISRMLIPSSILELQVLLHLVLIVFFILVMLRISKKNRVMALGLAWFFVSLIPVLTIGSLSNILASRYLYLPSVGMAIIFGVSMTWLMDRKHILRLFLCSFVIFCAMYLPVYNLIWKNNFIIAKQWLLQKPDSAFLLSVYGGAAFKMKYYDVAEESYVKAVSMEPENPSYRVSLIGVCSGMADNLEFLKAEGCFKNIIISYPNYIPAYYNLGITYANNQKYSEARTIWNEGLEIDPDNTAIQNNLKKIEDFLRADHE